ncbi:MAG: tRNA preQ1(34) S-adenosylmethionine ribosyltransferase-isomerase QueA [bacterium]|nr:tRNA preQ1(34) S-adenosylmethionine ribosyltransferase-isomerase QueA [bacterium]
MRTERFSYALPDEAVAQTPVEPRHSARLLRARDLTDRTVLDLPDLLGPYDLVVVNETKVRAARLHGRREPTGGRVELLLLGRVGERWQALARPARRLRPGSIIRVGELTARIETVPVEGRMEITLRTVTGESEEGAVEKAIARSGTVPLPPYIHRRLDDPGRYQTVYANQVGSAAAPTAGLHLTPRVLDGLSAKGIGLARVEIRIGLDTFRPIATTDINDHQMHTEWINVPEPTVEQIRRTRRSGGRVVAIGTTVVRALETAWKDGTDTAFEGPTDLYIKPGYRFRAVDVLLTNFHLPLSSLLVLVAAFVGDSWKYLYETALERGYRFLSFGDAMLLEPPLTPPRESE